MEIEGNCSHARGDEMGTRAADGSLCWARSCEPVPDPGEPRRRRRLNMSLTVELVYDKDCPHVAATRATLRRAFEAAGVPAKWTEWEQSSSDTPAHLRGFGSPTVLVEGHDVAGAQPVEGLACCRLYAIACVMNAARCGRVHCYITGAALLARCRRNGARWDGRRAVAVDLDRRRRHRRKCGRLRPRMDSGQVCPSSRAVARPGVMAITSPRTNPSTRRSVGQPNDSLRRSYLSRPGLAGGDRWVQRFPGYFVLGIDQ
jgi:hypothetical protein